MFFMIFNQKKQLFSSNICENPTNQCASVVEIFVFIFYTRLELNFTRVKISGQCANQIF
jgi:hypothetical protein